MSPAFEPQVKAQVDDFICYNHYPYLVFSSQAELDSHVASEHGGWLEYSFRFAFGLHKWNVFEKVGKVLRTLFIVGEELGDERIPAQPQIGPYNGFVSWSGDALVANPYTDKIVALVGFNQFGDYMQTVWLSPMGTPGDSQWFYDINKWMVELHFKAIDRAHIVPYYGQDGTAWCGPAAASMILKHFGQNVHMWDIADQLDIPTWEGVTIGEMRNYIAQFSELEVSDVTTFSGMYLDLKNYMISALDSGSPVYLEIFDPGIPPPPTHSVVVVGYYGDSSNPTFFIHDPSGDLLDKIDISDDYSYPYIAVEITWNQLRIALDGWPVWARAFHVSGTASLSGGSIDSGGSMPPVYASSPMGSLDLYFDRGINWRPRGSHLSWMDERDTLNIQTDISNLANVTQNFFLKAKIEVDSVVKWRDEKGIDSVEPLSRFTYQDSVSLASRWDSTKKNILVFELWDEFQNTQYDKAQITLPRPQETILFSDDFESYEVGTFPSPWELWFNTNGEIVSDVDREGSPTKSLRLWGSYGWSTEAIRRFTSNSRFIGYEVYGKVEAIGEAHSLTVGFAKRTSPTTSDWYAAVGFKEDGMIHADFGGAVQSYTTNRWYKIRATLDRATGEASFWIDDVLKSSGIIDYGGRDLYEIEGFNVASEWAAVNCYFDDAKVFEVSAILSVVAESPVNILVTAPNGFRIGYDSLTDSVVNEIEGATYSGPGTEPQVITIPSPLPGVYIIDRFGTGTGTYIITIESVGPDGNVVDSETWTGTTSLGELERGSIQMFEDGTFVGQIFGVIPEVPLGTIMASAAMIIALLAYVVVPRRRKRRRYTT